MAIKINTDDNTNQNPNNNIKLFPLVLTPDQQADENVLDDIVGKNSNGILAKLISENAKKTIYSIDVKDITYEIKIHHNKKRSVFKNGDKIAEIDESFLEPGFKDLIILQLLEEKDLEICFLLFSCLKIGEVEQRGKTIITSQKQLEPNDEPWS